MQNAKQKEIRLPTASGLDKNKIMLCVVTLPQTKHLWIDCFARQQIE